jgi:hypothetical protein
MEDRLIALRGRMVGGIKGCLFSFSLMFGIYLLTYAVGRWPPLLALDASLASHRRADVVLLVAAALLAAAGFVFLLLPQFSPHVRRDLIRAAIPAQSDPTGSARRQVEEAWEASAFGPRLSYGLGAGLHLPAGLSGGRRALILLVAFAGQMMLAGVLAFFFVLSPPQIQAFCLLAALYVLGRTLLGALRRA